MSLCTPRLAALLRWRCCTHCGALQLQRAFHLSALQQIAVRRESTRSVTVRAQQLARTCSLRARAHATGAEHQVRVCRCVAGVQRLCRPCNSLTRPLGQVRLDDFGEPSPEEAARVAGRSALRQTVQTSALDVPIRFTKARGKARRSRAALAHSRTAVWFMPCRTRFRNCKACCRHYQGLRWWSNLQMPPQPRGGTCFCARTSCRLGAPPTPGRRA